MGDFSISLNDGDYNRLQRAMDGLSKIEKNAIVQRGLQEGVKVFIRQGKSNLRATLSNEPQNVRMRTGNLMSSFTTKTKKRLSKAYAGFNKKGHHAHLVDSGTVKRWTKNGAYRGSVSKNSPQHGSNFWHSAVEQKKQAAMNELMDSIEKSIDQIITRNR